MLTPREHAFLGSTAGMLAKRKHGTRSTII
jgi:hypothetical protein